MPCPPQSSNQNYVVVTSSTRPTGFNLQAGTRIFEVDTLRELTYDGTGWVIMSEPWQTYTPQIDQGATTNIAKTVTWARYKRSDGTCAVNFFLAVTGTGTAGSTLTVTTPIASAALTNMIYGSGYIFDNSAVGYYHCFPQRSTASTMSFLVPVTAGNFGTTPNIAIATSDQIAVSLMYEMTTRYS